MKIGGRAVYPLETGGKTQNLIKSVKLKGGKLENEFLTSVLFVPLLKNYPEE
jgi:protein-L-isoaspartate O-methyltransferase